MDVSGITSMLNQTGMTNATNGASSAKASSLKNTANGLSSNSSDEELMEVLKDFESYFIEQMIKQMKETFTDDDEESSMASQYTDTFMDYAIEDIADMLLDEVGGSMTQQLFEQMKRNYNIPTVEELENEVVESTEGTSPVENI
jgi:flagellar protein FlgJ